MISMGAFKKLHSRNTGSYKILKISYNAYILNLPTDMDINNAFNVKDPSPYACHEGTSLSGKNEASLSPLFKLKEDLEDIVDHQIVSTRSGGYQKYLVKWKDCLFSDCTWVTNQNLQKLNLISINNVMLLTHQGLVFLSQGNRCKMESSFEDLSNERETKDQNLC